MAMGPGRPWRRPAKARRMMSDVRFAAFTCSMPLVTSSKLLRPLKKAAPRYRASIHQVLHLTLDRRLRPGQNP